MTYRTKLERVMKTNGVRPEDLGRAAGRAHVFNLMAGRSAVSLGTAVAIAAAMSRVLGRPVGIPELFDVRARRRRGGRAKEGPAAAGVTAQ